MGLDIFNNNAQAFWDEKGAFAGLHRLMPARVAYIEEQLGVLKGKKILDVGCGGGLAAEALARQGARVTGLDLSAAMLNVARRHAQGLDIKYIQSSAEDFARGKAKFDAIVALEIVEHVPDLHVFMAALAKMLKKDGALIIGTLNRTVQSYLAGIMMAELVLGWLPAGTHAWENFVRPSELKALADPLGLRARDVCGVAYNPLTGAFALKKGKTGVNYMVRMQKIM